MAPSQGESHGSPLAARTETADVFPRALVTRLPPESLLPDPPACPSLIPRHARQAAQRPQFPRRHGGNQAESGAKMGPEAQGTGCYSLMRISRIRAWSRPFVAVMTTRSEVNGIPSSACLRSR